MARNSSTHNHQVLFRGNEAAPAYSLSCNGTLCIVRAVMPSEAIRICCCCHFQQGGVHPPPPPPPPKKKKKKWQLNNSEWYPLNSGNKQFDVSGEALWRPRCCSRYLKLRYENASRRQHSCSRYLHWNTPCGDGPTTNSAVAQSWVVPVKSVIWVKTPRGGNVVVADIPTEIPSVAKGQLLTVTGQLHSPG